MRVKIYTERTIIRFGRNRDKSLSEVFIDDPEYIEWCVTHLDHFYIPKDTIEVLKEITPQFEFSEQTLRILEGKSTRDKVISREECEYHDRPSYGKYAGSYAQDYEGYSDDYIDNVFDGFADAYWNID